MKGFFPEGLSLTHIKSVSPISKEKQKQMVGGSAESSNDAL